MKFQSVCQLWSESEVNTYILIFTLQSHQKLLIDIWEKEHFRTNEMTYLCFLQDFWSSAFCCVAMLINQRNTSFPLSDALPAHPFSSQHLYPALHSSHQLGLADNKWFDLHSPCISPWINIEAQRWDSWWDCHSGRSFGWNTSNGNSSRVKEIHEWYGFRNPCGYVSMDTGKGFLLGTWPNHYPCHGYGRFLSFECSVTWSMWPVKTAIHSLQLSRDGQFAQNGLLSKICHWLLICLPLTSRFCM